MASILINKFKEVHQNITPGTEIDLSMLYTQDVIVVDPLKTIEGIDFFQDYFNQKIDLLNYFRIQFLDEIIQETSDYSHAFLQWQLQIQDQALQNGKTISIDGASFLKIRDQVFFQQNYYDLGALCYEHTPMLGYLVRKYKARISHFN